MTRKVKLCFLILVWSIVAIQVYVNYWEREKNTALAVTAFSVMEDSITEEWIKGYGHFGTMKISEDIRKKMLKNLAQKLGITEGYTFTMGQGDDYEKMLLTKEGKYAVTTLQIISMMGKGDEPEQYIVIEICTKEPVTDAMGLYQKVKRVYKEIGMEAQVSLEVEMEQTGNYAGKEGEALIQDVLDFTKAKRMDDIKENGIYTVYGYTRQEDSYLTLNGKKVNIQMVMSYAEEEDKTYVKIGVPLVNSSY